MNWRDVPMPARVAKLPRTKSGVPVPWVASWSSESEMYIKFDSGIQHNALYSRGTIGTGTATLGQMEPYRQRQAMVKLLCSVCGKRLRLAELWLLDNGSTTCEVRGRKVPLILEPWACSACLGYSLSVCPGLERTAAKNRILRVQDFQLIKTLVKPEGNLSNTPVPPGGVVSYIKIAPLNFTAYPSGEWGKSCCSNDYH